MTSSDYKDEVFKLDMEMALKKETHVPPDYIMLAHAIWKIMDECFRGEHDECNKKRVGILDKKVEEKKKWEEKYPKPLTEPSRGGGLLGMPAACRKEYDKFLEEQRQHHKILNGLDQEWQENEGICQALHEKCQGILSEILCRKKVEAHCASKKRNEIEIGKDFWLESEASSVIKSGLYKNMGVVIKKADFNRQLNSYRGKKINYNSLPHTLKSNIKQYVLERVERCKENGEKLPPRESHVIRKKSFPEELAEEFKLTKNCGLALYDEFKKNGIIPLHLTRNNGRKKAKK